MAPRPSPGKGRAGYRVPGFVKAGSSCGRWRRGDVPVGVPRACSLVRLVGVKRQLSGATPEMIRLRLLDRRKGENLPQLPGPPTPSEVQGHLATTMPAASNDQKMTDVPSLTKLCRSYADPLRAATAAGFVFCLLSHHHRPIHVLSGAVFTMAACGHVLGHTRWMRTVSRRVRSGLPRRIAIDAALAVAAIAVSGLVAVTGIAALLDPTGGVGEAHGAASVALIVVVAVHALRHRRRPRNRRRAPGSPRSRDGRGTRQPAISGEHAE
ncbi:MAG: hypothetical protein QG671_3611 [Actinomycetota bacterium]|nr:hypothetical protein [Actinomycetota bacterium]